MTKIEELRKKLIEKTQKKVKERLSGKEIGAIKAVNIIEDLDAVYNLLAEHIIDWHSYHFPELARHVAESETQLKLIAHLGERENFVEKKIFEHYNNAQRAKKIAENAKKSLGAVFEKQEIEEIKLLAINTLNLREERKFLAKFLEKKMSEIAPNFSTVAGHILAAKFLAKAGSQKKIAFMPSTTIQVLGADKALFSHLRNKTKPPKHGYLFSHPLLKTAPKKKKGKIAKIIAAKLSIAAKADYFGNKTLGEKLKKEMEKKVLQIK
ncbi:MAG: hypothetical protein HYW50_02145 [Candidatus Diapherotrites archaeon]|nr:hypothetical protein [Candidatus Diapherotrites archaeon]